jgi:hypothetical protein
MTQTQLELFNYSDETQNEFLRFRVLVLERKLEILEHEVKLKAESLDRTRKALFARNGQLEKLCHDVESRLGILERNICKGT